MKKGDKVICINDKFSRNEIANGVAKLKKGVFYTVEYFSETENEYDNLIKLEEIDYDLNANRFKTIKEWRRDKILKIENNNL